jgi:hypothetical protein
MSSKLHCEAATAHKLNQKVDILARSEPIFVESDFAAVLGNGAVKPR